MGAKSGIKWDGVSECAQPTLDVIGPNTQLILRDPKTKQEWVTTSQDYANFLVDNGILPSGSSNWTESNGKLYPATLSDKVGIGTNTPTYKFEVNGDWNLYEASGQHIHNIYNNAQQGLLYIIADDTSNPDVVRSRARFGGNLLLQTTNQTTSEGSQFTLGTTGVSTYATSDGSVLVGVNITPALLEVVVENSTLVTVLHSGNVGIGTTTPASKLTVTGGDIEVTDIASGVIIKSPDNTRWRITVDDAGVISAATV